MTFAAETELSERSTLVELFGEDWLEWELDPHADDEPERSDDCFEVRISLPVFTIRTA